MIACNATYLFNDNWRQAEAGPSPVVPGPPFEIDAPPISRLAHRLLHNPIPYFKNVAPSGFCPPPCCYILATGLGRSLINAFCRGGWGERSCLRSATASHSVVVVRTPNFPIGHSRLLFICLYVSVKAWELTLHFVNSHVEISVASAVFFIDPICITS